jgi:hypothetical protein
VLTINDLAFMASYSAPLGPVMDDVSKGLDARSGLHVICDAYGEVSPAELLDAVTVVPAQTWRGTSTRWTRR